jgi:hypothetical protein
MRSTVMRAPCSGSGAGRPIFWQCLSRLEIGEAGEFARRNADVNVASIGAATENILAKAGKILKFER